jgi:uncharacterized protein
MKLQVDRLTETPSVHRFDADPEWCREAKAVIPELALGGPAPHLELRAYRMASDVYLEGSAHAEIELVCSRCLAPFRSHVAEPFRLVLEPAGDRLPAEPEAAAALARDGLCLSDELESGWFRGSEIDLGRFYRDVLALVVPVQPLCRDDCKGLCPRCGVDRNLEACRCAGERRDSPFASLAALRGATRKGEP